MNPKQPDQAGENPHAPLPENLTEHAPSENQNAIRPAFGLPIRKHCLTQHVAPWPPSENVSPASDT